MPFHFSAFTDRFRLCGARFCAAETPGHAGDAVASDAGGGGASGAGNDCFSRSTYVIFYAIVWLKTSLIYIIITAVKLTSVYSTVFLRCICCTTLFLFLPRRDCELGCDRVQK